MSGAENKTKTKKRSGDDISRYDNPQNLKKPKSQNDTNKESDNKNINFGNILSKVKAYILNAGIEKARLQIFKSNLLKYGGSVSDDIDSQTTLIIVDDKHEPDKICRLLKLDKPLDGDKKIVRTSWLSQCFRHKKLIDVTEYCVDVSSFFKLSDEDSPLNADNPGELGNEAQKCEASKTAVKSEFPKVGHMWRAFQKPQNPSKASSDSESDYDPSSEEESTSGNLEPSDMKDITGRKLPVGNWICAQSSKNPKPNFNKSVTDKLEEMVKAYESTNDKWRAFGYQKAIQALKKYPKEITTWEEAKALPSVGSKLADKIWEIIESGDLRKLNELKCNEDVRIMELFTDVWGAGPTTARSWYQQGFRSLDDLKTKANLTHQQKVGLAHYHDFLDRMPRAEAGEIEKTVRKAAESLVDGVIAQACGSYRRGKATCGDVDVLVTHPDGKSHRGLFAKLLAKLKEEGFLTDDLVTAEDSGNQKKYLGVCRLPGEDQKYRRLDIIVVPYDEYACALVYFTGSAHLNRSLRHLAKKTGMSLSEHSLNTGVVRKGGEKIYEGTPLPTPTEESVFTQLGVPYRPPEERDH